MKLKPGDIFLVRKPSILSTGVNIAQTIWSKDSRSKYTHCGIIVDEQGKTFEAGFRIEFKNFWIDHAKYDFMLVRHECINQRVFDKAFKSFSEKYEGEIYPVYRLLFHLVPPLAKLSAGKFVCSELVARFLYKIELFPYYNGATPDNLHDMFCWGWGWEILKIHEAKRFSNTNGVMQTFGEVEDG